MGISVLLLILTNYIIRPSDWMVGVDLRLNLILIAIAMVAFVGTLASGRARESWDRCWLYLIIFYLLMMLSSIVMGQVDTISKYTPQMLTNILVFMLVCSAVQNARQLSLVTGAWGVLALFVVYQCHVQVTTGTNIAGLGPLLRRVQTVGEDGEIVTGRTFQAEWLGVFADPNDTGLLFITVAPIFAASALFGGGGTLPRLLSGATATALIYGVILTNSRGAFVALLGAVGYFFILRYRSVKGLVAAGIGGFALVTLGPSRMAEITSGDDSAMERVYAWIEALWAFSMYPIFGLGPKHWQDWHHKTTHNSFVLAFVENGFAAYVCWLAVLVIPLYLVSRAAFDHADIRVRTSYAAFGAGLAGMMLDIFFISRTYILVPYFVSAYVLTHCRVTERDRYLVNLSHLTPIRLAAIAAFSIVMVWITNILTTRLL